MQEMLPKVLRMKMFTVLLDSNAAEHAARTMAMQIATDNANELLQELTVMYNKAASSQLPMNCLILWAARWLNEETANIRNSISDIRGFISSADKPGNHSVFLLYQLCFKAILGSIETECLKST